MENKKCLRTITKFDTHLHKYMIAHFTGFVQTLQWKMVGYNSCMSSILPSVKWCGHASAFHMWLTYQPSYIAGCTAWL
jgi:hypothetical protein